jgi:MFS family permease
VISRAGPLHEREFRLLFAGQLVSRLGSAIAPVALAFVVLDLTGSASDLGIVLAARQIPTIVFLLVGGVWADRLPRHRVMVASNLVSGASQAVAGALLLSGGAQLWHLAALAAVNGASSAFFFPASQGIVPQTVPDSLLQQANATLRLAVNATNTPARHWAASS